ncbi:MAG: hypothetical protein L6Q67_18025 [Zoogloea sp.]|nr:hypothetical protein [Zoogloea sp.]
MSSPSPCPCGASADYTRCCGRYLDEGLPAPTAEALMRSRYTAYTQGREDYLQATWHPAHRPESLNLDEDAATKWLGLAIKACCSVDATHATVEFVARYKIGGRAYRLHETSRFALEDGHWLYTDGDIHPK